MCEEGNLKMGWKKEGSAVQERIIGKIKIFRYIRESRMYHVDISSDYNSLDSIAVSP